MTENNKTPPKDMLDWFCLTDASRWRLVRPLGAGIAVMLAFLVMLALLAGAAILGRAILDQDGTAQNAGIVIAAIVAAPYLLWSMSIRHKLFGFQKEGQITDRILNALEQLGTEKTLRTTATDAQGNPQRIEKTVPNIEIRIGGLLALERIAQDSARYDRGRDHVRVLEILCAYIRQNAPASTARDFPLPDWPALPEDPTDEARQVHEMWRQARFADPHNSNARDWARSLPVPRVDIQMALNIVTQRSPAQRRAEADWGDDASEPASWVFDSEALPQLPANVEQEGLSAEECKAFQQRLTGWREVIWAYGGYRLDLSNTNLQGANLSAALLCGARMEGARMEGANLAEARLEGARLSNARITGANLFAARLQGARLLEAKMEGAYLRRARLEGALLTEARLEGALLYRARLEGADLRGARLEGADFGEARMEGVNLTRARMDGASLFGAQLEWANLFESNLQRASLFETQLKGADLRGARMEGAYVIRTRMDADTALSAASMIGAAIKEVDFADVRISSEQLLSTFGDTTVTMPRSAGHDLLNRPGHWPKWALPVAVSDGNDFPTQWNIWQNRPQTYTPPPPPGT